MKIKSVKHVEITSEDESLSLFIDSAATKTLVLSSVSHDDKTRLSIEFSEQESEQIKRFLTGYFSPGKSIHCRRQINRNIDAVAFDDEGTRFELYYSNMGEPYRDGFCVDITCGNVMHYNHYAFFREEAVDTWLRAITS